jgi:Fe-S-cluster-containing dehydrogenase component/formate-dependent nitrite reductase membrane component NrfD
MNYGFVIDTRACIGCHACSTACKSENDVPLGVHRTWVKYTETGRFPDVRRNFQVTRCNHCANPPCVRICPVAAMFQRPDGIVDFDGDACIGCKACLQACPYDAIYLDPGTQTAAKCNYCAHRVEQAMEPACVVVCPTHAIVAGDLDDPASEIARVVARNDLSVRKPEQGTAPKLFYVQGHAPSLHPTALPREPLGVAMVDVLDPDGRNPGPGYADAARYEVRVRIGDVVLPGPGEGASRGDARTPGIQGVPAGPIHVGQGRMAGQMVAQVAHTAWHTVPWHWQVPAYLVTKSVGAGAFFLLAVLQLAGAAPTAPARAAIGAVGLAALVATTALLVGDLGRPERFLRILTRPQWHSWLTRGAFLLVGTSLVSTAVFALDFAFATGWMQPGLPGLCALLATLNLPLTLGTAVYTAFLFGQCEGRDLWQSPLLPLQLMVQMAVGAAAAGLLVSALPGTDLAAAPLAGGLVAALALHLLAVAAELGVPHASEQAARAAHAITHGRHRREFWIGGVAVGHAVPGVALLFGDPALIGAPAAVLALAGLYVYENVFVRAPQTLPNS